MASGMIKSPILQWLDSTSATGIHWNENGWTCPANGFVVADISLQTGGATWYYYIKDLTADCYVGKIAGTKSDGTSRSILFFVKKGHIYKSTNFSNVMGSPLYMYYYKFT